jgi:hypothetical protein
MRSTTCSWGGRSNSYCFVEATSRSAMTKACSRFRVRYCIAKLLRYRTKRKVAEFSGCLGRLFTRQGAATPARCCATFCDARTTSVDNAFSPSARSPAPRLLPRHVRTPAFTILARPAAPPPPTVAGRIRAPVVVSLAAVLGLAASSG